MTIVVRADASIDVGTGHVVRCLTLADVCQRRGDTVRFVCRITDGDRIDAIRADGFEVTALDPAMSVADEALSVRRLVDDSAAGWLVVDHYDRDASFEDAARGSARVMAIDDLADRPHSAQLLLDQNLGRTPDDYASLVPDGALVLTGPTFALLRPEFAAAREDSLRRRRDRALARVMISMGGVDRDNVTAVALDALAGASLPAGVTVTVVLGARAPWLDDIRRRAALMPWPTDVLTNGPAMAMLMSRSDLAIGAGGGTAWERCCLGLPTVLAVIAPNQAPGAAALARAGAALVVDNGGDMAGDLRNAINACVNVETRRALTDASAALTDGRGATRVAEALA